MSDTLGRGFLEKSVGECSGSRMTQEGHVRRAPSAIYVYYDGKLVGELFADIFVEETNLVELKATNDHRDAFPAQCLNYLHATGNAI